MASILTLRDVLVNGRVIDAGVEVVLDAGHAGQLVAQGAARPIGKPRRRPTPLFRSEDRS